MPFAMIRNDITSMNVDAIVSAADSRFSGGGGVDAAIRRAAGPGLEEACRRLGQCPPGEARITRGFDLDARFVIHTVGPVWKDGHHGERETLASCYLRSLGLAEQYGCESIAFPLIASGTFGYPEQEAIGVAMECITGYLESHDMMIYLVLFSHEAYRVGREIMQDVQAYIDDVYVDQHSAPRQGKNARLPGSPPPLFGSFPRPGAPAGHWPSDDATLDTSIQDWDHVRTESVRPYPDEPAPKEALPVDASADRPGWDWDLPTAETADASFAGYDAASSDEGLLFQDTRPMLSYDSPDTVDWDSLLSQTDEGFSQTLLRLIDERGLTDSQCYKRANVDRKLFSKIRSNPDYRPSKPTVFAFAVALHLSLSDTQDLLEKAGFALTHSSRFDIILEYFIRHAHYDVYDINDVLFQYDMPLLGSGMR